MPTVAELGQKVKAKYPAYAGMSDIEIGRKVKAKYPEYSSFEDVPDAKPESSLLDKGVGFVKDTLSDAYKSGGEAVDAGSKLASNVMDGKVFNDENAGLASKVIRKGGEALVPIVPLAIGAGVATAGIVPTAATVGAGLLAGGVGSYVGRKGAEALGASPNVQDLAGDVGGLVAGGGAGIRAVKSAASRAARTAALGDTTASTIEGSAREKAAQAAARRVGEVENIKGDTRQLYDGEALKKGKFSIPKDNVRLSPLEQAQAQFVESSKPALDRVRAAADGPKADVEGMMTRLDNRLAEVRRPNEPALAVAEKANMENALRDLATKKEGDLTGFQLASTYLTAQRELSDVARGALRVENLPGGGGEARMAENQMIVETLGKDFQKIKGSLEQFAKEGILDPAVKYNLVSPNRAEEMGGHPDYVKWIRPFTPVEREVMAGQQKVGINPVLGKGTQERLTFLDRVSKFREPENVIQATLDQAQDVHRIGAANMALVELAKQATKFDPTTRSYGQAGMLKDFLLVPGGVKGKAVRGLDPEIQSTMGSAPVWIAGREHTLFGPPATLNAINGTGQVSADVSLKVLPVVKSLLKGAARAMKLTTTGALNPARKGVNMAYNVAAVYQQLPLAVSSKIMLKQARYTAEFLAHNLRSVAKKVGLDKVTSERFDNLLDEGRKRAAFSTSSEIVRGVGEQHADYLAAKGSPDELFRHVIVQPAQELGKAITGQKFKPEVIHRIGTAVDDAMRSVEDIATADESGLKMAVYDVMEKYYGNKGMDAAQAKEAAAWDARNIITDFTRKGNFAANYDYFGMPFVQAAITGIRTNLMYASKDPVGFAARTSAPVIGHMWVNALNYANPRTRQVMADIPQDVQARNLIIPTGEPIEKENGRYTKGLLVIPMPESPVVRAFAQGSIAMLQQQNEIQNAATVLTMAKMAQHFLPINTVNPADVAAQIPVVGPVGQVLTDHNQFTKGPVVTNRAQQNAPDWALKVAGGDRKKAAQAAFLANRMLPVTRYIKNSPPQDEGADNFFRWLGDTAGSPFSSVPGGETRRRQGLK